MHVLQDFHAMNDVPAEEQLRRNVLELMKVWRWNQATLADKLGRSQPWLSRRLKAPAEVTDEDQGHGTRFHFSDLDALSTVFGLSPAELLQPMYGKWDRRSGAERRSGVDRRRQVRAEPTNPFDRPIKYGLDSPPSSA